MVVNQLGASRMRSGALGMCRNAFFDLTPAPALAVYTPRAAILSSAGARAPST